MATLISPASRSRVRIAQIVETNRGETPSSGAYKILPHLDSTVLNQTQTFERSNEVKSNRMGGKQVGGNIQAGGTIGVPLKNDSGVRELIESAFSGTFSQLSATNASTGTTLAFNHIGAKASGTVQVAALPADGETVIFNGVTFTFRTTATLSTEIELGVDEDATASNMRDTLAASTNSAITVAVYTVSTDTVTVTYKTVGTVGNSYTLNAGTAGADLTLSGATLTGGTNGADEITRLAGSWINEGWQVGDQIRVTGATTSSNNIANADLVTIAAVSALTLTLSDNANVTTDENFSGGTTLFNNSFYLKAGAVRKFFTHEASYLDLVPVVYEYFRGMEVNTLAVNIPTAGEVTGEFAMIGLIGKITETEFDRSNNLSGSTTVGSSTRSASAATVSFAGSVDGAKLDRGGSLAPEVESMTVNVNNNRAARFAVGQQSAAFVEEGDLDIEMTFALYFRDKQVQEDYLAGTRTSLTVVLKDQQDGHKMTIEMPNVVFTAGDKAISGQAVVQNMTAFAEEDETHATKARVWVQPLLTA